MALFAVAERRLRPGAWAAYLDAMRAIDAYSLRNANRGPYTLYVAENDPDQVLGLGVWRRRDDLVAAAKGLSRPLQQQLDATVEEGGGAWSWFESVRQRRAFTHQVGLVAAALFRVAVDDGPRFRDWATEMQNRAIQIPGVLTQHLLVGVDDPEATIHLAEYHDHAARRQALDDLEARPCPVPMVGLRRFVGRIGHYWAREEALGQEHAS